MKKSIALLISVLLAASNLFAADVSWAGWVEAQGTLLTSRNGDDDLVSDQDEAPKASTGVFDWGLDFKVSGENFGLVTGLAHWTGAETSDGTDWDKSGPLELKESWIWSNFNPMFKLIAGMEIETAIKYQPGHNDYFSDQLASGLGSYNYMGDDDFTRAVTGLIGEVSVSDFSAALVYRLERDSPWGPSAVTDYEIELKDNIVLNVKYALPELANIYGGVAFRNKDKDADGDYVNQTAFWVAGEVLAVENLTAALQADVRLEDNMDGDARTVLGLNVGYVLPDTINFGVKTAFDFRPEVGEADAYTKSDIQVMVTPLMVPVVDVTAGAQFLLSNEEDNDDTRTNLKLRIGKSIGNVTNRIDVKYAINGSGDDNTAVTKDINEFGLEYAVNIWF